MQIPSWHMGTASSGATAALASLGPRHAPATHLGSRFARRHGASCHACPAHAPPPLQPTHPPSCSNPFAALYCCFAAAVFVAALSCVRALVALVPVPLPPILHRSQPFSLRLLCCAATAAAAAFCAMLWVCRRQYLLSLAPEPGDLMAGVVAVLQGNLARTRYTLMPPRQGWAHAHAGWWRQPRHASRTPCTHTILRCAAPKN